MMVICRFLVIEYRSFRLLIEGQRPSIRGGGGGGALIKGGGVSLRLEVVLVDYLEEQEEMMIKYGQESGWGELCGTIFWDQELVDCLVDYWEPLLGLWF